VDSEHNAIHQCLRAGEHGEVKRLVLTASGGPFRKTPIHALARVTPEQALAHPNWRMGNRITIDSATLMNKGFEVIEARWLFSMGPAQSKWSSTRSPPFTPWWSTWTVRFWRNSAQRICACPFNMR